MGLMRFVSPSHRLGEAQAGAAYMAGYDRIPWRTDIQLVEEELLIERENSDSGNLYIPWQVNGHGRLTLSTTSLMEQMEPYCLPVELARGKLAQLRNQMADWESAGVEIPERVAQLAAEAMRSFGLATCRGEETERAVSAAGVALRLALDAAQLLVAAYASQSLADRREEESGPLSMFLGGSLGAALLDENTSMKFLDTFNAACVPIVWREIEAAQGSFYWDITDKQIEWCRRHNLKVCAGPLLVFDPWHLPAWLSDFSGDFDGIVSCVGDYMQEVAQRYGDAVDVWICAARMNNADALALNEHERIRLTARAIEVAQSVAPDAERLVAFDQSWGEYLSRKAIDFSPLHFADALVRARLGLTGLLIEMNVGYEPAGTPPREPLDMSRHLDHWSLLGAPVHVSLVVPSSNDEDALARRHAAVQIDGCSQASQAEWVERFVPLMLAKPYVRGVLWNQLRDSEPHDFPHGGLFDARRQEKAALSRLGEIRRAHLT